MKNIRIIALLFLVFFSSCRKDVNLMEVDTIVDDPIIQQFDSPTEIIIGDVVGFVVDENDTPIPDAIITLNNLQLTTNANGHFFVNDENMNKLGTLVRVQKDGYFDGSRSIFPLADSRNRVKIQLLEKSFDYNFDSTTGGTIFFDSGASIKIDSDAVQHENGDLYTGTVHIATKWLDPTAPSTGDQMPGNLQGVNTEFEQVALATYGMIAIEFQGENGESLNVKDGEFVQLTMPIPTELLAGAPSEIPLWSYNEEYGLWVEESSATIINGAYVGDVTHFSFWNCDDPFDLIYLDMTLVDDLNNGLDGYYVMIELNVSGNPISAAGHSDGTGNVSGYVPMNEAMNLKVLDHCDEVIYTQSIGPFSMDYSLGNISVPTINSTTIFGNLLDCNNNPITDGYLKIEFDGRTIYHYTPTSAFNFTFPTCANTVDIEVIGVDLDALQQSNSTAVPSNTSTDMGDVIVCGNPVGNSLTITVDGVTQMYTHIDTQPWGTTTFIHSIGQLPADIGFGFNGQIDGNYDFINYMDGITDNNMGWKLSIADPDVGLEFFEVTQFDTKLVGTFSGEVINKFSSPWVTVPLSGEFSIDL